MHEQHFDKLGGAYGPEEIVRSNIIIISSINSKYTIHIYIYIYTYNNYILT